MSLKKCSSDYSIQTNKHQVKQHNTAVAFIVISYFLYTFNLSKFSLNVILGLCGNKNPLLCK